MRRMWIACCLAVVALAGVSASDRWPQFRGGTGGVAADNPALPDVWSQTENVVWSVEVPGTGWRSPIVWGDTIFVTSVIKPGPRETPDRGFYGGTGAGSAETEVHRWMVYAYFGGVGLFVFDLSGKPVWSAGMDALTMRQWGTGASPALHGDRLLVVNDNDDRSSITAYDKRTGRVAWRVPRDEGSNWSTPFIWEHQSGTEIVTTGSRKVRSYDLSGTQKWELSGMTSLHVPTPVAAHGLLFISSGFLADARRPVYAIRPGATGDISLKEGETSNRFIAWSNPRLGTYDTSPLVYGDYYYTLMDRGFLLCHDAKTGKEIYPRQRITAEASGFTASPWAYNGKIFALSEDGDTFVMQAGPEFKVLGKNPLGEMALATPAVAGDTLIIRTASKLYRIGKRNGR